MSLHARRTAAWCGAARRHASIVCVFIRLDCTRQSAIEKRVVLSKYPGTAYPGRLEWPCARKRILACAWVRPNPGRGGRGRGSLILQRSRSLQQQARHVALCPDGGGQPAASSAPCWSSTEPHCVWANSHPWLGDSPDTPVGRAPSITSVGIWRQWAEWRSSEQLW